MISVAYEERKYRRLHCQADLVHFQVVVKETDLDIAVERRCFNPELLQWLKKLVTTYRRQLETYIQRDPQFASNLKPYLPLPSAPPAAVIMAETTKVAGVGPLAAVAGAFAQYVGEQLCRYLEAGTKEIIVENGGDIYIRAIKSRRIGIFAGNSPFSQRMALEIAPAQTPLGICTSAGTVGHSLSFGNADAVVVLSPSTALADAVATASANLVNNAADLKKAVDFATSITGVTGALAIYGDKMAIRGAIKLIPIN